MMCGAHLFVLCNVSQAGLELLVAAAASVVVVAAPRFSQCNVLWESFPSLGVQGVEGLILIVALFLLDGGGEKKERKKKKYHHVEGGFPQGWTHLAGCAAGCSC
jgi:hypothetical protein